MEWQEHKGNRKAVVSDALLGLTLSDSSKRTRIPRSCNVPAHEPCQRGKTSLRNGLHIFECGSNQDSQGRQSDAWPVNDGVSLILLK